MNLPPIYQNNNIKSNNQTTSSNNNKNVNEIPLYKKIIIETKNGDISTVIIGITKYNLVTNQGKLISKKDIISIK